MKVLMTGSHGFVGTNLIEALSGAHEIIRWDVRSGDALLECDAVIHLAGKAHDTKNTTKEGEYYEVNTELTKKMYDAFLKSSAKKFIFFSSIKAKDNDTPYAKSKYLAEQYILSHTEITEKTTTNFTNNTNEISRQARDERSVYILRPCMIHGKDVKGNLPLLFKLVKKGWAWPLADFENQRSYASMGNVSFVVNGLLNKDVESGVYNLCDDVPVSTNELIRLMSECLGHNAKGQNIPKGIICFMAKVGDVLHLPLNTERLRKLTEDYMIDNSDIKKALGIEQMPVKAVDGLKFTINELIKKD